MVDVVAVLEVSAVLALATSAVVVLTAFRSLVLAVLVAEVLTVLVDAVDANAGALKRALPLRTKPSNSVTRRLLYILEGHASHDIHNTDFAVFVK